MTIDELMEKLVKVKMKYGGDLEIKIEHEGYEQDDPSYIGPIEKVYVDKDGESVSFNDHKDGDWGTVEEGDDIF